MEVQWIPIRSLKIADYNPREARSPEIIRSIVETSRSRMIFKPIVVRKTADGEYEVLDGGTRLEALKMLGADKAPCIVYDCDRREAMEIAAIIHTGREELTSAEKGKFILRCINEGVWRNVEEASRELGFSKETVYDWIREARLHPADSWPQLRRILNRDARRVLATMPKPVREKIVEELSCMDGRLAEKVRRHIHSILRELADTAGDREPEEVIGEFRRRISALVEGGLGEQVKFRGPSGLLYELQEVDDGILVRVSDRGSQTAISIPRIDLREILRRLSRFVHE